MREDFFFPINIIPIHLPILREQLDDLPLLVEHFMQQLRAKSGKNIAGVSAEAMELLMNHQWPGNVRELGGVLEHAFVIAEKGPITPEHLPAPMKSPTGLWKARERHITSAAQDEKTALVEALLKCCGNQTQAARLLGVNRVTVWHRVNKHGIDIDDLFQA